MKRPARPERWQRLDEQVRDRASRLVDALRRDAAFAGTVRDDEVTRSLYAANASICYRRPACVVVPAGVDDVVRVMELATEFRVPVTPRGAGSSVAGQSLGNGVILDFSPRMNRLLAVHEESHCVSVEPGIIRDRLNIALKARGLWFPPDPSSGAFCTIGGMIASNSGGAHSLKYGTTKHYIEELEIVLADGRRAIVRAPQRDDGPTPLVGDLRRRIAFAGAPRRVPDLAGAFEHDIADLIARHRDALLAEAPRTFRCSSGYNLFEARTPEGVLDLTRVLCGSEGTLGVIVRATLRLLPLPPARAGLTLHFDNEQAAYDAVPQIVDRFGPSTVQAMSRDLLQAAADAAVDEAWRRPTSDRPTVDPPDDRLAVMLLVEFDGDDERELRTTAEACEAALVDRGPAYWGRIAETPNDLSAVWIVRKSAAAVLSRMPGAMKPTRWIEDGAVPADRLAEFIAGLRGLFAEHGIDAALFGHAGQGLMHFSPPMDAHAPDFADRIEFIARAHAKLLRAVDGVPSGEHGDGLLRTPLLPETFPRSYAAMRAAKQLFDPAFTLNPAVIVPSPDEAGAGVSEHLRYGRDYRHVTLGGAFDSPEMRRAIELCHGCNSCRTYCPVVGLGDDEEHLPRAKANLLRDLISGVLPADVLDDASARMVVDFCASCGLCLDRCPTHVDIPGISNAFRARAGASRSDTVLARPDVLTQLAMLAPTIANSSLRNQTLRRVMQKLIGLAPDAPMPRFRRGRLHAPRPVTRRPVRLWDRDIDEVAVFVSCEHRGADQDEVNALTAILAKLGIGSRLLTDSPCCARPLVTTGQIHDARPMLARHRRTVVEHWQAGRPTLVVTPSCLPPFAHQLTKLWPDDRALADAVRGCIDATDFLAAILPTLPAAQSDDRRIVVHSPCSLRATGRGDAPLRLLQRAGARESQTVDVACCGALGTWSLKASHIDDSLTISQALVDQVAAMEPPPDLIASPAGNCRRWIESRTGVPTVHPLVLLAEWMVEFKDQPAPATPPQAPRDSG